MTTKIKIVPAAVTIAFTMMSASAQGPLAPPAGSPTPEMKSLQEVWDRLQELNTRNSELEAQLTALTAGYGQLEALAAANEEIILQLRSFAEGMASPPTLYPGLAFTSERVNSGGIVESMVDITLPGLVPSPLSDYVVSVTPPTTVEYSGRQHALASGGGVTASAYTKGILSVVEPAIDLGVLGPASGYLEELVTSDLWYSPVDGAGNPLGQFPVIEAGGTPEQYGDPDLVITGSGTPIIAYRFDSGTSPGSLSELRVAVGGPTVGSWTHQTVDDGGQLDVGHEPSIAIVSIAAAEPAICYEDRSNGRIVYSRATSPVSQFVWGAPEVVATNAKAPSLAVNGGTIGVSFYDTATQSLGYASRSGGVWTVETVETDLGVGEDSALSFTSAGNPVIAYRDQAYNRLKVAEWDGSSWQISVVTDEIYSAVSGGIGPAIAVLPSGNIGVACLTNPEGFQGLRGQVTYLEREAGAWTRFSVDFPGRVSDLAIAPSGRPLVSYHRPWKIQSEFVPEVARSTNLAGFPMPGVPAYTTINHLPGELRISVPR